MLKKFLLILIICFISPNGITAELDLGFSLYQSENFTEAFPRLLVLAKSGDSKAAGLVARMYVFGLGTQVDQSEAFRWGSEAAKQDDPLAQNLLGILYKNGWGVTKNLEDSIFWFKKSADQNFILAFANLGDAYAYGQGVSVDRSEAVKWYERAALADNAYALFMASILIDSFDKEKSFNYLKASADQGFGDAIASLGDRYYYGDFVEKNYYEAYKWYELASNAKSRYTNYALYMLGYMAFWGHGEPKNIQKAIKIYQKASDAGEIYASNELGRIYQNGIEVEENQELSFHYYLRSANLGNQFGQVQSAMHLLDGRGVLTDKDKAKNYFELSAKQGNYLARLNLLDIRISDNSRSKQLSRALEDIKALAIEYQKNFPISDAYRTVAFSDLAKRIQAVLEMKSMVWDDKKNDLLDNLEKKIKARELVKEINFLIKKENNIYASEESKDYLTIKRYELETIFWRPLFSSDDQIDIENEKISRFEMWEKINSFADYLQQNYPPQHVFFVYSLEFKFSYFTSVRKNGMKASLIKFLDDFSKSSVIASRLASDQISNDATCVAYLAHIKDLSGAFQLVFPSGVDTQQDMKAEINSIIEKLENSDYCLDKKSLDNFKEEFILSLAYKFKELDSDLIGYLLKSRTGEKGQEMEVEIARTTGNFKKEEKLMREMYAESIMAGPTIELLKYYLRDKEYDKAKAAIRKSIKQNLSKKYDWNDSAALNNIAKLPEIISSQKIFLLKKSVEFDRRSFYSITEQWKNDEIIGAYDWYNHDAERALIEELFDKKRNIEAELIIRFLKINEISELLRNADVKNDFELPEWFYTDEEKKLNKFFQKYLDEAIKSFRFSGAPNYINGENVNASSEIIGDRFVDFLITGRIPADTPISKKQNSRLPDRLGQLINSLPPKTVLLQYIINGDNLLININFPNRKLTKKINIKDQAIDTKISLLRGAINKKQNLTSVSSELYKILFKPIEVELIKSGINHIMLSLDGKLRYVPFSALWDENQFLIQKYTFTFFDEINESASIKINTQQIRVAGFGVSKNIAGFSALPGVQAELQQIVRNKSGGIYPGKIILDNEFTFEELRNTLKQNYPVVHIATHFKFSPGTELNSFLLLGDGNHLDLSSLKTLDFKGVDLVTYSACQTGMGGGKDEDGKEIAGLSYITQKNGAKAVIASLWSVSDKSTSELMTKMYKIISKSSVSVSDALQQAKLELFRSSEYSHPFYWAGFQLYGNAR